MMKGYWIDVKNELLDPKHVEAMGISVWLFMYLIDKTTTINETRGKVNYGVPITYIQIAMELGISEQTYSRWIIRLRKAGYINTVRTPRGLTITVNKAAKRFKQKTSSVPSKMADQSPSKTMEHTKSDPPLLIKRSAINGDPIKTINNYDKHTVTKVTDYRNNEVQIIVDYFEATFALTMPRPKYQRFAAKTLITRHGAEVVKRAIDAALLVRDMKFAPRILSIEDLRDKWNNLVELYRKQQVNQVIGEIDGK